MHPVEQLVGLRLAQKLGWFISPQFVVAYDRAADDGGSDPDFVCLDFKAKMVRVVEVSAGYDLNSQGLPRRIKERQKRWLQPIRRMLGGRGVINDSWGVTLVAFVRNDRLSWFVGRFPPERFPDVEARSLEDAITLWSQ